MAVTLLELDTEVSVAVAWPLAFVVSVVDESVPELVLKVTVAPARALPFWVRVTVIVLVDAPSAGIVVGEALTVRTTRWNVTLVVFTWPLYVAVTVAVTSLSLTDAVRVDVA